MFEQRLIGSPEKTKCQIAHEESCPDSARSFRGGLHPTLQLHRTLGNRRVAQLIQSKRLAPEGNLVFGQPKLTAGAPDDQYDQEADRVVRHVTSTSDVVTANSILEAMSPEADNQHKMQTKPVAALVQRQVMSALKADNEKKSMHTTSAGSMFDTCTGAYIEPRIGHRFSLQRFGFGSLDGLIGSLFGDEAPIELEGKAASTCTEKPTIDSASPVPVTINADSAVEFVEKIVGVLGGNPHMAPSFSWAPDVDERGVITKVNLKLTTSIIRPRFGSGRLGTGGRDADAERALIKRVEALIQAHEERHRDIARDFAQRAVCAAIGKQGQAGEAAIKKVLCDMNKAQESLDGREGMIKFTLNADGTQVIDVGLTSTKQSYPCNGGTP